MLIKFFDLHWWREGDKADIKTLMTITELSLPPFEIAPVADVII